MQKTPSSDPQLAGSIPAGKSWPSKPGGDLQAPWPENELRDNSIKTRFSVQIARFQFLARGAEVRPPSSVK
jgi:hypothetical protein